MKLSDQIFCYLLSYLSAVYAPGALAFCYCFYGIDLDSPVEDTFCMVDSILIFISSVFLAVGNYKERREFIIVYIITVIACEIAYWAILIYSLNKVAIIMHYEFLQPAILWKVFQIYGLYRVIQQYRAIKKQE